MTHVVGYTRVLATTHPIISRVSPSGSEREDSELELFPFCVEVKRLRLLIFYNWSLSPRTHGLLLMFREILAW